MNTVTWTCDHDQGRLQVGHALVCPECYRLGEEHGRIEGLRAARKILEQVTGGNGA